MVERLNDIRPNHNTILHGDCAEVLKTLPDNYFSAMITDPPAGIAFMGKGKRTGQPS